MGEPDRRPHLVVTGFGEFAGVKSNPSTWLVQQLQSLHAQGAHRSPCMQPEGLSVKPLNALLRCSSCASHQNN